MILFTPLMFFAPAQQGYVVSLSPSFGPASGGMRVTVSLSANQDVMHSATCLFNNVASPAELLSASAVTCLTPRAPLGPASFQLIVDGQELAAGWEEYSFVFVEPGVVHSVTPSVATTSGGGLVTVTGTFFAGNSASCRFGPASVPAFVISSSLLRCATPAAPEGRVALRVSLNGADFAIGEAAFVFTAPLRILALSPPATTPGNAFTIAVAGMRPGQALSCLVGARDVGAAAYVNDSAVNCTCPLPALGFLPGNYSVALAAGGATLSGSVALEVLGEIELRDVVPSSADARGGDVVRVRAEGLDPSEALYCIFGSAASPAAVVARGVAECEAPATRAGTEVRLSLLSPRRRSHESLAFLFAAPSVHVTSLQPSSGPLQGGTHVTITGAHFAFSSPACRFGTSTTTPLPTLLTSSSMVCVTPAAATPGGDRVEVRGISGGYSSGGARFLFERIPIVREIIPSSAIAHLEGGGVTIHGEFPRAQGTLFCRCSTR